MTREAKKSAVKQGNHGKAPEGDAGAMSQQIRPSDPGSRDDLGAGHVKTIEIAMRVRSEIGRVVEDPTNSDSKNAGATVSGNPHRKTS